MRDIGKAFRRPHQFARCRFACPTGTAASQGFRPGGGRRPAWLAMPRIAAPRACSPKTLGNRLYESLSALLGVRPAPGNRVPALNRQRPWGTLAPPNPSKPRLTTRRGTRDVPAAIRSAAPATGAGAPPGGAPGGGRTSVPGDPRARAQKRPRKRRRLAPARPGRLSGRPLPGRRGPDPPGDRRRRPARGLLEQPGQRAPAPGPGRGRGRRLRPGPGPRSGLRHRGLQPGQHAEGPGQAR